MVSPRVAVKAMASSTSLSSKSSVEVESSLSSEIGSILPSVLSCSLFFAHSYDTFTEIGQLSVLMKSLNTSIKS